jgi:hypothetical protein
MNAKIFESMTPDELRRYIEFLLWHYRVVDSFWFIHVHERFDQATAERINERVWAKAGGLAARDLRTRFQIEEKGLKGFVRTLRLFPWCILIDYRIDESDNQVLLTVPSCPTQEARKKRGLGEYECKEMHRAEFECFAQAVDDRIQVECLFAPPDPHPPETYCQWRFSLRQGAQPSSVT